MHLKKICCLGDFLGDLGFYGEFPQEIAGINTEFCDCLRSTNPIFHGLIFIELSM